MEHENAVLLKGTQDGITIVFDESVDYEILKEQLAKKVEDAAKFFEGGKTSIAFRGKEFSEEEQNELVQIICEKTGLQITFLKLEETAEAKQVAALLAQEMNKHNLTKFHKGSIRSGQKIEFEGSVVVIGDVNPGGEVKAEGNIIVLGQLKGMAHAGCKGMTDAFVMAVYMVPVQLRIGDIITRFPEENKRGPKPAEYAYIEDGQIYVMPLS